ncbi:MAG TPA: carboxypeptidase-like regulatory domain-containing protein, partial [Bryobacteraceae bacterium]|nr:carboxypeptidase-like regulatory domain-containing protein [Bryobacteraceae bacterium]
KVDASDRRVAILLAPAGELRQVTSLYVAAQADAGGNFRLRSLAPGNYKLFAFEHSPQLDLRNPEAVEKLDALGEPLKIEEGATVQANPKVITAAQMREVLQ